MDIIGRGNWGSSLARALPKARVISRAQWRTYREPADIVWLAVGDRAIPQVAAELARRWKRAGRRPELVLHSSGALDSGVLEPVRGLGAAVGSAHPWMTFPSRKPVALAGVWFALEGDATATRAAKTLIRSFAGRTFPLLAENKALYHAFGTLASPLMASHLAAAEAAAHKAGLPPKLARNLLAQLAGRTLENYRADGAGKSFSGPIARGDAETLGRHMASLKGMPERDIYAALAGYAIERLPARRRTALRASLKGKPPA